MSLMTRAVGAFTVLSLAAIPVAALTINNTSSHEVSVAVDNGSEEAVYKIPAGGSIEVTQDCSSDCAVTGPWGFSRLVAQNATVETDGGSLVTADLSAKSQGLIPQNPVSDTLDAGASTDSTAAEPATAQPAPVTQPKRAAKPRKPAGKLAKKGPAAGSFQMLFQGPGK